MFKKPNLGSAAESSKKDTKEQRSYFCSLCSLSFQSSQSFAGHHNRHRLRWGFAQEDLNNSSVNNSRKRPLSSAGSITSGSRHNGEHISRAIYNFMPTSTFGVEREQDQQASGSSTGTGSTCSYSGNPKKRKLSGLARLKTGSAISDKSWLKL